RQGALAAAAVLGPPAWGGARAWAAPTEAELLRGFGDGDVCIASGGPESPFRNNHEMVVKLGEDRLLKPLRKRSGIDAAGGELGGWYSYDPHYDYRRNVDTGFAPACTFGQWVSALARAYAITGDKATRDKVLRLNRLYAETISPDFYRVNRFPAYTHDKLLLG